MNSNTNIISRRAFLKQFASLQKLKNKVVFKLDTYCSSRQKAIQCYFLLQSSSNLLNLVPSSMKWSLPYPTRLKTRLTPIRPDFFSRSPGLGGGGSEAQMPKIKVNINRLK